MGEGQGWVGWGVSLGRGSLGKTVGVCTVRERRWGVGKVVVMRGGKDKSEREESVGGSPPTVVVAAVSVLATTVGLLLLQHPLPQNLTGVTKGSIAVVTLIATLVILTTASSKSEKSSTVNKAVDRVSSPSSITSCYEANGPFGCPITTAFFMLLTDLTFPLLTTQQIPPTETVSPTTTTQTDDKLTASPAVEIVPQAEEAGVADSIPTEKQETKEQGTLQPLDPSPVVNFVNTTSEVTTNATDEEHHPQLEEVRSSDTVVEDADVEKNSMTGYVEAERVAPDASSNTVSIATDETTLEEVRLSDPVVEDADVEKNSMTGYVEAESVAPEASSNNVPMATDETNGIEAFVDTVATTEDSITMDTAPEIFSEIEAETSEADNNLVEKIEPEKVQEKQTREGSTVKIKVFGVGGGGGNAVNRMMGEELDGIEYCIMNTDIQALGKTKAETLVLGMALTRGLGAGGRSPVY